MTNKLLCPHSLGKKHHANIPDSKVVNKTLYSSFLKEGILIRSDFPLRKGPATVQH